jgi:23S rRNA pseudouridine955/2504/2580 synthase
MTGKTETLVAGENDAGKRLDRVLRRHFPRLALSGVYRLIRRGRAKVNGRTVGIDYRLSPGDRIVVPAAVVALGRAPAPTDRSAAVAQLEKLTLFRNKDVLALNKPAGALAHGPGSLDELVAAAFAHVDDSLSFRPGPAHRLDRETTGVQLWSLSLAGARELARLFRSRGVMKVYCALVAGRIGEPEEWEDRLERDRESGKTIAAPPDGGADGSLRGLPAFTSVLPVIPGDRYTLLLFLPKTGRTHQLRFQAARRGHPLPGDGKYGGSTALPRFLLHSLGLRADSDALRLPPLVAPFDRFGRETVTALFGPGALEDVYRRCRELLGLPPAGS